MSGTMVGSAPQPARAASNPGATHPAILPRQIDFISLLNIAASTHAVDRSVKARAPFPGNFGVPHLSGNPAFCAVQGRAGPTHALSICCNRAPGWRGRLDHDRLPLPLFMFT